MKPTESFVFGLAPGATTTNVRLLCARSLSDIRKHENFGACIWPRINDLDSATVI
jgi:hypothetical protein